MLLHWGQCWPGHVVQGAPSERGELQPVPLLPSDSAHFAQRTSLKLISYAPMHGFHILSSPSAVAMLRVFLHTSPSAPPDQDRQEQLFFPHPPIPYFMLSHTSGMVLRQLAHLSHPAGHGSHVPIPCQARWALCLSIRAQLCLPLCLPTALVVPHQHHSQKSCFQQGTEKHVCTWT